MDCDDVVRYGIAKCNGIVTLIQEPRSSETLFLGTFVRIVQQLSNMYLAIQVCDTEHRPNVWKDTIWFCPLENILPVASELWQIILAISSPLDRVNLVQSPDFCYYLKHEIKVNDYTYAQHNDQKIKCLVKSIGPAKHVGPGTYFELQPLDVNKDDNQRPFECLFVAANKLIKPTTADQHKNHIESFNQIMNDEKYLNKKSNKGSNLIDVSKKRHPFQSTLKSSSSSSSSSTCSASSLSNVAKRFTHPENHDDQIRLLKDIQQTHLSDPPNHRQKHTVNKNDSSRNGRKEDAKYVLEFGNSNKRDQSIDLMEVLIGDWPKNVPILSEKNKSKCYNDTMEQVKHERNKSANPISHLLHKNKSVNHKHSEHLSTGFEVNDSKKSNNLGKNRSDNCLSRSVHTSINSVMPKVE